MENIVVYWASKNGLWKIGKWDTSVGRRWYIENTDTGFNDNPIIYDDGRVAFDEPYILPKYVKEQFKILANKERKIELSGKQQKKRNVSDADISPAMKEIKVDLAFENMLNEKREINRLLNQPFFKIAITENINNPEVERIFSEMIDIANEDFISRTDSGITELWFEL